MRALTASELLKIWECGLAQRHAQRALTLLSVGYSDTPVERIARWSIGRRDACLLELREQIFGRELASLVTCPACNERLEFTVDTVNLRQTLKNQTLDNDAAEFSIQLADYQVSFRLPNSLDLTSLDAAMDAESNRRRLLEHCLIRVQKAGTIIPAVELPAEVVAAIGERMAEADPDAQVALQCPGCHHAWQSPFDILSFLWTDLHVWATRLLREVHTLASRYGWHEADILALSPLRRQVYLEMTA